MIRFFIVYCSVCLFMHFYTYFTVKRGLAISKAAKVIFGLFVLLVISGPILVRIAERGGFESGTSVFSYKKRSVVRGEKRRISLDNFCHCWMLFKFLREELSDQLAAPSCWMGKVCI